MTRDTARRLASMVAAVAAAGLVAACSSSSGSSPTAAASAGGGGSATTVDVSEKEFVITLGSAVPSGSVTFSVKNDGTIPHEFVVFRTDDAADALPIASDEPEVNEDDPSLTSMGEVEDVDPGTTKSFTANLTPGKYVAICNVEGHYQSGMKVAFTVP